MEKYGYFILLLSIANILLLFFAATGSSTEVPSENKKLIWECFDDFLVLQLGAKTEMHKKHKQQFVLDLQLLNRAKVRQFLQGNKDKAEELRNCVDRAWPNNSDTDLMDIFRTKVEDDNLFAPSQRVQEKLHNAQCLLDLGVIEGKILMKSGLIRNYEPGEEEVWFQEVKEADKHIVISAEGIKHMRKCLLKGKVFGVKIVIKSKSNKQHLLQLDSVGREELVKIISKQVPFSEWLLRKIANEQSCVADWLVKHWHAKTRLHRFYRDPLKSNPPELWRSVMWIEYEQQNGRPTKVHFKDRGFWILKNCLFRKAVFLKFDAPSKQYSIDLKHFFQLMGDVIYTSKSVTQELNTQSDCLAKFLAIKSGDGDGKCLLKKREGPGGVVVYFVKENDPFRPYIINYETPDSFSYNAYALSVENCHLQTEETGIYIENERMDFELLWNCGVRMMTMGRRGKKAINARKLLEIHTREQLYLRGIPVEIFPQIEPSLDDNMCVICQEGYGHNNDHRSVGLSCGHTYHGKCLQNWIQAHDSCPTCRRLVLDVLKDPKESEEETYDYEFIEENDDYESQSQGETDDHINSEFDDDEVEQQQQ